MSQLAALTATSALAPGKAAFGALDGSCGIKVALFSGMFKAFSLRAAMESAAKIGYDGIEILVGFGANHLDSRCTPQRAAEIKSIAEDNNLNIRLIYTTLGGGVLVGEERRREDLDGVDRFLDIGDQISCKMLKVTAGRLKDSAYRDDEAQIVSAWLGEACDRAAKHGSRIVAEIHFGQYCETVDMACRIIDLVDRPNFGVIHDAGNLHITGDAYGEASMDRLRHRIFHVHVKDMVSAPPSDETAHDYPAGRFKRAMLGHGDVDYRSVFKGLKNISYDGYVSCEASGGDDPEAVAKHEFEEVRRLLSLVQS